MATTFQKFRRGLLVTALLAFGFAAGWLSAIILGGRFPAGGDVAALLGPGLGANQATPQQLRDQFGVFWEVWNLVENEFYHRQPLDRARMIRGAISGMLGVLDDQYTVYQEPDLASQTNDHMQGTLEGIGAYIRVADGKAYIDKVFKESPARSAGLRQSDEIVKIDGVEIAALIGEHLSNQGGSGYFFFVIEDGTAEVNRDGQVVAKLGPEDFFGEIAILSTPRRTATVTASTPMTLLAMFGADFAKFSSEMPALADRVQQAIAERS